MIVTLALNVLSCDEVVKVWHSTLIAVTPTQVSCLKVTETVRETESKSVLIETQRWNQMGGFSFSRQPQ